MIDFKTWNDDESIIRCALLTEENADRVLPPVCNVINCDSCSVAVLAAEATVQKQGKPGWHILCPDCFERAQSEIKHEIKMMGRIRRGATEIPNAGKNT